MLDVSNVRNQKTKNSVRNTITGFALKILELIFPFIVRTVLIYKLGLEYAGLNSLFTSVLQTLSIAELGVGTCMVVHMYKPVNDGDIVKLCALMKLYKLYYRIIGMVILIIGSMLVPFLPKLIAGEVPPGINLYVIYALNLGATVISYWLFAYRNSLFVAYQRLDITNNITFVVSSMKYTAQILVLIFLKNYYVFLIISLLGQIVINIVTAAFSVKYYPDCKPVGELRKDEYKKINDSIKDLFTSQLGHVITNSVDSIVISAFLGLMPLSIYQNYYYILTAIISFFTIFYNSVKASVGNGLLNKSQESNYDDFKFIVYFGFAMLTLCTSCFISLVQTFMTVWVGGEYLLGETCVFLFGAYLLTYELSRVLCLYKDAAGKWHADRYRPLIAAAVNLVTNIIFVNTIGIAGVLLSTIVAYLFINTPWIIQRLFIDVFDGSQKRDCIRMLVGNTMITVFICVIVYQICNKIVFSNLYLQLLFRMVTASLISMALYLLFHVKDSSEKRLFRLMAKIIH